MRIVLFNLNNYIGGGEVYILNFVRYLHENSIDYAAITYPKSYIEDECKENGYNYLSWPTKNESYLYSKSTEKKAIEIFFESNFRKTDHFLICNMRELYSFLTIRNNFYKIRYIQFKNILFHPEEYKYGSRLSLKSKKIEDFNQDLLGTLDVLDLNIYPNQNARNKSVKGITREYNTFFPFPSFSNPKVQVKKDQHQGGPIKILTISRFVSFKISSILELIRVVKKNKNYELTIIGYGRFKLLIQIYTFLGPRRIALVGKVNPNKIHDYIAASDIGVAQGTSILQMTSTGLPTIISPYSKWYDFIIGKRTCSFGVFTKNNLEFGDKLTSEHRHILDFQSAIDKILFNYKFYRNESLEVTEYLNSDKIFNALTRQIHLKIPNIDKHEFKVLKPSFLKRAIKSFL